MKHLEPLENPNLVVVSGWEFVEERVFSSYLWLVNPILKELEAHYGWLKFFKKYKGWAIALTHEFYAARLDVDSKAEYIMVTESGFALQVKPFEPFLNSLMWA